MMRGKIDPEVAHQLVEINEQLVLATLRAQVLAEEADAARLLVVESEERFRSLVTSTAAIVWFAGSDGQVRIDPERWCAVTGLGTTEGGADWLEGVHADDRARVQAAWRDAVAARTVFECEYRLYRRGGGVMWVFARGVPLPSEGGPVREWIGMMTDVTDRKRVEETRERFISVLGHDLRTPLAAIQIGAETLDRAADLPEHHARMVELIAKCSGRMGRMIADMLDFARGRLGNGIPLTREPTNFGQVCSEAISELRVAHPGSTIIFESRGDLVGKWDTDRVAQVLTNLVGNAIVHGDGPVRVSVQAEDDGVVLEVQNHGPPIPPEDLRVVFEPFRPGSDHGHHDGLGLGLYIVSEIIRAHEGTICASSTRDGVTTFSCRWPRCPPTRGGAIA